MKREQAEVVALQVLGWLAADQELIGLFLGASGAGVDEIRARAQDPHFQGAVLDFLLQSDEWVLRFSQATGLAPTLPGLARQALPGGETPFWT